MDLSSCLKQPSHPQQQKHETHERMVYKTLDIRQRKVIPERQVTNEARSVNVPTNALRESLSQHNEGKPRCGPAMSLSWVDNAKSPKEEWATHRENSKGLQRDLSLEHSGKCWSAHVWGKTTRGQRKNHLRGWERTLPGAYTKPGMVPVPTGQAIKPQNSWGIE